MLAMFTRLASGRVTRWGRKATEPCTTPQKFTSMTEWNRSSGSSAVGSVGPQIPALLTTMSTTPCSARTASTRARISASEVTST